MVLPVYRIQHNAEKLAEKDPFDLKNIKVLEKHDISNYYSSIVYSIINNALQSLEGFNKITLQCIGTTGLARYFYNNEKSPRVENYLATENEKEEGNKIKLKVLEKDYTKFINGNYHKFLLELFSEYIIDLEPFVIEKIDVFTLNDIFLKFLYVNIIDILFMTNNSVPELF